MKNKTLSLTLFTGLLFLGLGLPARADDEIARTKLVEATEIYKGRADPAKVTEALALVQAGLAASPSQEAWYDLTMLRCRILYWQGMLTVGDAKKIVIHNDGNKQANAAIAAFPNHADAYYWSAAHLGRWAEANGIVSSLGKKNEIMATLGKIANLKTKAGDPGKTFEGYGADRILGRLYFKLPGFAGGSLATSLKHLDVAYTNAPNLALNTVFYAESLASGTAAQKTKAKQILDALLALDPAALNLDRVPETAEEFKDARKLRTQLGK